MASKLKVLDFKIDKVLNSIFDSKKHENTVSKVLLNGSQVDIPDTVPFDKLVTDYIFYIILNYITNKPIPHRSKLDIRYDAVLQYEGKIFHKENIHKIPTSQQKLNEIDYSLKSLKIRDFTKFYNANAYDQFVFNNSVKINVDSNTVITCRPSLDLIYDGVYVKEVDSNDELTIEFKASTDVPPSIFEMLRKKLDEYQNNKSIRTELEDNIKFGNFTKKEKLPEGATSFTDIIAKPADPIPEHQLPVTDYSVLTTENIKAFLTNNNLFRGITSYEE